MTPNIIDVKAQEDYQILLSFENGEMKIFHMKPYIDKVFLNNCKIRHILQ
ncbi:MAG: hypothetical protein Q9M36_07430 [Sulfurovum sp.]|nr:hypothetical protein [Sulfurovum sp.]